MWSLLLGLVERWWREKPRLDAVRDIVRLRDAMHNCEESYRRYLGVKDSIDRNEIFDLAPVKSHWHESIDSFSGTVAALYQMIEIFSPELRKSLFRFEFTERRIAASEGWGAPLELDNPFERTEATLLFDSYQEALSQLDQFIRSTFKPEEVLAVQRSRLR